MFAFGHLIGVWILGKVYEKISKKKLGHYGWFFLLFGALLPDIDFLFDWTLGTSLHRTFTHSLLFALLVPLILWCSLRLFQAGASANSSFFQEKKSLPLAICAGILSHLLLDMLFSHGVPLFWPSMLRFAFSGINYSTSTHSFLNASDAHLRQVLKTTIADMAMGTAWIFYLWLRRRIKF